MTWTKSCIFRLPHRIRHIVASTDLKVLVASSHFRTLFLVNLQQSMTKTVVFKDGVNVGNKPEESWMIITFLREFPCCFSWCFLCAEGHFVCSDATMKEVSELPCDEKITMAQTCDTRQNIFLVFFAAKVSIYNS